MQLSKHFKLEEFEKSMTAVAAVKTAIPK